MSKTPNINVVVCTAIFDFVDYLKEPDYFPDNCKFVCFTNLPLQSENYEIKYVKDQLCDDPVRRAKIYKILAHRYFSDYEYTVWIDGTMFLTCNINDLIEKYLAEVDMAFFAHRWRKCIYVEADKCIAKGLDNPEVIKAQMQKYKNEGYPENNGLIDGSIILRRNSPSVANINEHWWSEIQNHSRRDQLSFNYVAHKNSLKFSLINGNRYNNPYFGYIPHLRQLKKIFADRNKFRNSPEYTFYRVRKKLFRILSFSSKL